ncbi:hypothetical protein AWM75_03305 [Aerococcus urinaehominis]|uniref:Uncharacterized protein n=1 Tax=Aerococcus urinaehominis TaxID=128944 RepID=A0A109RGI2_9LACT|nr:FAD-dependent oxidoreductase [Aerococcus urinaehominis]AMB99086.1 hypothetical protein AWM75_03305 [Aerococcus urinaehominis]SDM03156.1 NADPH-dependent 2,4-dienoyl-CoA reductase, sulfur reductase [Aerococcus urinaehominis]
MKYVIVGTSHAGYEAAQTILKQAPEAEIHLYERGQHPSFLSCGIQSYLEGISQSLDQIHYANEASYKKQGINIHINSDVTSFDADNKTVTVETADGSHQESYDKLIISPGGSASQLNIPGKDLDNVYFLRGREWAGKVKERMSEAKKAVVIGAGYIGIEAVEAFAKAGIDVTVIDVCPSVLYTYLDQEFIEKINKTLTDHGVTIKTGESVEEITGQDGLVSGVKTDKATYKADTVLMTAGMTPNTGWLKGLVEMDDRGFVKVDSHMQSSVEDVYVAGDATLIPFGPTGEKVSIALATTARRQGVIAALSALGHEANIRPVQGTSGLTLFEYHFATTGIKDSNADQYQGQVASKYIEMQKLPDFMADDTQIFAKIHFDAESHRILGGQMMSTADITDSVNTLSLAIDAHYTLEDLAQQDFFFQPGYDKPWHYLNVLAIEALGAEVTGADKMIF